MPTSWLQYFNVVLQDVTIDMGTWYLSAVFVTAAHDYNYHEIKNLIKNNWIYIYIEMYICMYTYICFKSILYLVI